ncbi:Probable mRNA interferase HicA [Citrobacter freundii]|nr:Probable mRNA interferase HicA [Citrobacter freundii]
MKQSEFRRWLESQGVVVTNGSNHLKLRYHGRRSVMPWHPGDEIKEALAKIDPEAAWFTVIINIRLII